MKHLTTVNDSGAHIEDSKLLDVCGAPDTAAQTVLAKLHEYLVRMSDLNRQRLSNMTSVGDVIVMSHARRWPLRCCASESEAMAHVCGRGWFLPARLAASSCEMSSRSSA